MGVYEIGQYLSSPVFLFLAGIVCVVHFVWPYVQGMLGAQLGVMHLAEGFEEGPKLAYFLGAVAKVFAAVVIVSAIFTDNHFLVKLVCLGFAFLLVFDRIGAKKNLSFVFDIISKIRKK